MGSEQIRRPGFSAGIALMLVCALAGPGQAQQDSSAGSASAKQPAHKATSKTSGATAHKSTASKGQTTAHKRTGTSAASKGKKSSSASTGATKKPAPSSHTASAKGKRSTRGKKTARTRGQQKIDSERAQTIQEALIREHYLDGEPTGKWSDACDDAMRRYQADHGWQTKVVPDSRALISLGLGPSKDHLLNPESAMTTGPENSRAVLSDAAARKAASDADKIPGEDPLPADAAKTTTASDPK